MSEQGLTATLIQRLRSIDTAALPGDVQFLARQCLLDWLGCALAGSREPLTAILRALAREDGGTAAATLIGTGEQVPLRQAALVNGAASHALDYDDVQTAMSGHPSVPVLSAVLALGEARGATVDEVLAAFVVGVEAECLLGSVANPGHYAAGFHATGTLGTFGAAAACASLLRLDEEQWRHAFGLAAAQAAGLKSMFGTMTKPFHAGRAAENGLLAALLAERGFTAHTEALEVAQGFLATHASSNRALPADDGDFAIRSVLFKYHAACYGTHETIEGVLRLKERHRLRPEEVVAIDLEVPAGNLAMCNIPEPRTALEGKFSLRFTAALALAGESTGEDAFTDEAVRRPSFVAVRDRVRVRSHGGAGMTNTTVHVRTVDGRELSEHVDLSVPERDLERQWQRLTAKYLGLAEPVLGRERASSLHQAVRRLAGETVRDLAALTVA